MKQRAIRGTRKGKKSLVRQSSKLELAWRRGKAKAKGIELNDPRLDDQRAWMDF